MPKISKKKTSLKDSLLAHQNRAENAQRAKAALEKKQASAQRTSFQKQNKKKAPASGTASKEASTSSRPDKGKGKATIPFQQNRKILLVGEGNYSFARALLQTPSINITPSLLYATSYDSEAACAEKYPEVPEIVSLLRERGATVHFSVDATRLEKHKEVRKSKVLFDTVVFNFPHVGSGIKDQDRNIRTNQNLILQFLQSIAPFLAKGVDPSSVPGSRKNRNKGSDDEGDDDDMEEEDIRDQAPKLDADEATASTSNLPPPSRMRGSVLITLRDAPPYTLWDVPRLAKNPPIDVKLAPTNPPAKYKLVRSFVFHPDAYEGYEHRRTLGGATGLEANEDLRKGSGICRTWEFVLTDESMRMGGLKEEVGTIAPGYSGR